MGQQTLAVSDNPDRYMQVAGQFAGTYEEAVALLSKGFWEAVTVQPLSQDAHCRVLDWLIQNPGHCPPKLVLISCSPLLVMKVKQALSRYTKVEELGTV